MKEPGWPLDLAARGVPDVLAGFKAAGIDAHEHLSPASLHADLEGQSGQGRVGLGRIGDLGFGVGIDAARPAPVQRAWQIGQDAVENRLDADVFKGRGGENRRDLVLQGPQAQGGLDSGGCDDLAAEVGFKDRLIVFAGRFHQPLAPGRGIGGLVVGQRSPDDRFAVARKMDVFHGGQINDGRKLRPLAKRDGHGHGIGAQLVAYGGHGRLEIGPGPVELVDHGDLGHAVSHGLPPDRFGLGLHAGNGAKDAHRAVEHPKRALHFDGEVDMARGVDDIDLMVFPGAGGAGRSDGDAAFLLLGHEIHGGGAVMNLAHAMDAAGKIEDALGERGLAGVDVGDDADIAQTGQAIFLGPFFRAHASSGLGVGSSAARSGSTTAAKRRRRKASGVKCGHHQKPSRPGPRHSGTSAVRARASLVAR